MYEAIFNIDLYNLVAQMPPLKKRTQEHVQWLMCLIFPVANLYTTFLQYRNQTNYKLNHTAQVFSLEKVLNDSFDTQARRIYIQDGQYTLPIWFYDRTTNKPVLFYDREDSNPVLFYDRASLETQNVDFTVVLPAPALSSSELIRLKALIDFYRLPDKTYTITYE